METGIQNTIFSPGNYAGNTIARKSAIIHLFGYWQMAVFAFLAKGSRCGPQIVEG